VTSRTCHFLLYGDHNHCQYSSVPIHVGMARLSWPGG